MLLSTPLLLVIALFLVAPDFPCRCLCNGNTSSTKGLHGRWSNLCKSSHSQSCPTFSSYGNPPVLASFLHSLTPCNGGHGPHVGRQPHDAGGLQPFPSPSGHPCSCFSLPHVCFALPSSAIFICCVPRSLAVANLSGRVVWAAVTDRIGVFKESSKYSCYKYPSFPLLGSRNTFHLLCFGSVPLFLSLPPLMSTAVSESSTTLVANFALAGFCVNSFLVRLKLFPLHPCSLCSGCFHHGWSVLLSSSL